jgi:hypothetical protein
MRPDRTIREPQNEVMESILQATLVRLHDLRAAIELLTEQ